MLRVPSQRLTWCKRFRHSVLCTFLKTYVLDETNSEGLNHIEPIVGDARLEIFTHSGRAFVNNGVRDLTSEEQELAHYYVLLNCRDIDHVSFLYTNFSVHQSYAIVVIFFFIVAANLTKISEEQIILELAKEPGAKEILRLGYVLWS